MRDHPTPDGITFAIEDPGSPDAVRLMEALVRDMLARYDEETWPGPVVPRACVPPRGAFVVARSAGRAVGCGGYQRVAPGVAELKRMWVDPGARGRGIARALVAHLEGLARAAGYGAMRLESGTSQPEALRLYERAGYVRAATPWGIYVEDTRSVYLEKALGDEADTAPADGDGAASG
jgi:putative acetyltransferase